MRVTWADRWPSFWEVWRALRVDAPLILRVAPLLLHTGRPTLRYRLVIDGGAVVVIDPATEEPVRSLPVLGGDVHVVYVARFEGAPASEPYGRPVEVFSREVA